MERRACRFKREKYQREIQYPGGVAWVDGWRGGGGGGGLFTTVTFMTFFFLS